MKIAMPGSIKHFEEETNMQFLSPTELRFLEEGREEGRQQGRQATLLYVLQQRFGELPEDFRVRIRSIHDENRLDRLVLEAALTSSLEAFSWPE